jgi:hypothetical protein
MTQRTGKRRVGLRGSRHMPDAIVAKGKLDSLCFEGMRRRGMR